MGRKSNNTFWLGLGVAAGAAFVLNQAMRRKRAAAWEERLVERPKGVALVTGASSGIGEVYARRLAKMGFDLVLVARRAEKLEELASHYSQAYGVHAEVLPVDLGYPQGTQKVVARIERGDITFLVNNAGFGLPGSFASLPPGQTEEMIRVHILAAVLLTRAALPFMLERGQGAIVNVSSVASFLAMPDDVTYASTKDFLRHFTQSLALTEGKRGIRFQVLCPGYTSTGFHHTPAYSGIEAHRDIPDFMWLNVEDVVNDSLACLAAGETVCVPGLQYKAIAFLARIGIAQYFIDLASLLLPDLVHRLRGHAKAN